ncbi:MAG: RNB domain-containing ribonuclease [Candidatus Protistobacter heckmanni]|nr:RNB domain-containing ribonuclease [Candidatus Protistobacter heckmanni]
MHLLFEESGDIKAATILAQQGESWQAESASGKRFKIKAKDVLMQFAKPGAEELLTQAGALAGDIDLPFLWECAPEGEFGFADLAGEYFGADADPVQQTALALALHGAPVYFRRKGRGRFQRAPEDQLQAALAALERKRQQGLLQDQYTAELKEGRLPAAFEGKAIGLLFKPDKNSIEYKALDAAASALGKSHTEVLIASGGIASPFALHTARFMAEYFPKGRAFPAFELGAAADELEFADVQAFSIDDSATTEIDDAFSVAEAGPGRWRVGIHIAAPALGIARGDSLDAISRDRLSTVYFPGDKITMLPEAAIEAYTLKAGAQCPAVSLYLTVDTSTWDVLASETRVERISVAHNLRHDVLDTVITEDNLAAGAGDYPCKAGIAVLWPLACELHEGRQKVRISNGLRPESHTRPDYSYALDLPEDGEHAGDPEHARVRIEPRKRGAPLDKIVAELMILANSTWGKFLADAGVPGIYRAQRAWGAVRTCMQTTPAPHEGLGVAQYSWSTSPLRRYVDLVNQWQIISVARNGVMAKMVAPFTPKDVDLMAIAADFDTTYAGYADYQATMERYWCLRWLKQENRSRVQGVVLKNGAVRLAEVPLVVHMPDLAELPRGSWVLLEVVSIDEIRLEASCRLIELLAQKVDDAALAEEELAEEFTADGTDAADVETAAAEHDAEAAPDTLGDAQPHADMQSGLDAGAASTDAQHG